MSLFIKIISLYNHIHFLAILYPTSLANLVVEVGIRHCHQILLTLGNKPQWNLNWNSFIFIRENAFENVFWKMAAILSWPQCVNWSNGDQNLHYCHLGPQSQMFVWIGLGTWVSETCVHLGMFDDIMGRKGYSGVMMTTAWRLKHQDPQVNGSTIWIQWAA